LGRAIRGTLRALMDMNGIAHIQLTVTDMDRSRAFYRRLLVDCFGMTVLRVITRCCSRTRTGSGSR
jgi:hypothetical protein